jgi:hypothetical protein
MTCRTPEPSAAARQMQPLGRSRAHTARGRDPPEPGLREPAVCRVIQDSLRGFDVRPGSYAIKRYGGVEDRDASEERVEFA